MNNQKIIPIFKDGNIVVPIYFLKNINKFSLNSDEFLFLMYLYQLGDKSLFNPNHYSEQLNIELPKVMEYIGTLTDKGFIQVEVVKNDKGLMEEVLVLDNFYNKISYIMMEEVNNKDQLNSNVFELIEKEFGRTLGSIEIEIISAWLESNISEDLIKEALKEAVFNGVSNLKYIDTILYEWGKAGIKTVEQVEERRKKRKTSIEENSDSDIDLDIVDWNWFDGDE